MILVPFIAGGVPPTQSSLDIDSAAGELSDSSGFSELLDMFGAAVEPAETPDEALDDGKVELAPALSDNEQADNDRDEVLCSALTPASFISLVNVTVEMAKADGGNSHVGGVESEHLPLPDDQTAAAAAAVVPSVALAPNYLTLGAANPSAGASSAPLSGDIGAAASVGMPAESEAVSLANYPPSSAAAQHDASNSERTAIKPERFVEQTVPMPEANSIHADLVINTQPIESAGVHDQAITARTAASVATPSAKPIEADLKVNVDRRDGNESVSFAGEITKVAPGSSGFEPDTDSHAESFQGDARSFAEHGDFKLSKDRIEQVDTAVRHFVPDRIGQATVPLQHHENISGAANATAWRPVIDRVADEIIGHVQIGQHEAVLQLDPPELGKIKIDLWVDGGEIHARIVADEQSTRTLIESHLPELHRALDAGRVEWVTLHVDHQETARGTEQWAQGFDDHARQGRRQGQSHGGSAEQTVNDFASTENPTRAPGDTGRISMWA